MYFCLLLLLSFDWFLLQKKKKLEVSAILLNSSVSALQMLKRQAETEKDVTQYPLTYKLVLCIKCVHVCMHACMCECVLFYAHSSIEYLQEGVKTVQLRGSCCNHRGFLSSDSEIPTPFPPISPFSKYPLSPQFIFIFSQCLCFYLYELHGESSSILLIKLHLSLKIQWVSQSVTRVSRGWGLHKALLFSGYHQRHLRWSNW